MIQHYHHCSSNDDILWQRKGDTLTRELRKLVEAADKHGPSLQGEAGGQQHHQHTQEMVSRELEAYRTLLVAHERRIKEVLSVDEHHWSLLSYSMKISDLFSWQLSDSVTQYKELYNRQSQNVENLQQQLVQQRSHHMDTLQKERAKHHTMIAEVSDMTSSKWGKEWYW